jgi:hypothetical protein
MSATICPTRRASPEGVMTIGASRPTALRSPISFLARRFSDIGSPSSRRLSDGSAMEALWSQLGAPALDQQTAELLTKGAGDFGGTVAELAAQRDAAEIRLIQALDGTGEPD